VECACVCIYCRVCIQEVKGMRRKMKMDGRWTVCGRWVRQTSRGPWARWTTDLSVHKRVPRVTEQREGIDREGVCTYIALQRLYIVDM
jgi:hypothetical protein